MVYEAIISGGKVHNNVLFMMLSGRTMRNTKANQGINAIKDFLAAYSVSFCLKRIVG